MTESISPYALLCACKPKSTPAFSTNYDLYSAAQQTVPPADGTGIHQQHTPVPAEAGKEHDQTGSISYTNTARKTHYISDIHTRHRQAVKRSTLTTGPIS